MQRALAEIALIGLASGALGCWVVLYEFSYAAESLAHSIFPGLVIATHDLEQARRWDSVLCLNRRQIAAGPPRETLDRGVLEATYGGEIVEIPGTGGRGILPPHHHHH